MENRGAPGKRKAAQYLVAALLGAAGAVSFWKNGLKLDWTSLAVMGMAVLVFLSDTLTRIRIGPTGLEAETRELANRVDQTAHAVDQTADEVKRLRIQVDTTALASVFNQVSEMNRLVISQPSLARTWAGFENLADDEIRQIFYIYVFLDAFEVLRQVSHGEPLSGDYYNVWRRTWIRELLNSKAAQTMKTRGLFNYYSDQTKDEMGL